MNETVNQDTNDTAVQPEKTFTQSELDAIINDRLRRERSKYEGFEDYKSKAEKYDEAQEAAKTDLQKAQEEAQKYKSQLDALTAANAARDARDKVAAETGVPASLLHGSTEEECKTEAEALLTFRGETPKYPSLRDGGEARNVSGGKTRDQFSDWFKENF